MFLCFLKYLIRLKVLYFIQENSNFMLTQKLNVLKKYDNNIQ